MLEQQDDIIVINCTEEESKELEQVHLQQTRQFLANTQAYRIENWYYCLEQFTFKSIFFQLTALEAYCLNLMYYETQIPQEFNQTLKKLQEKVDKMISAHFQEGCFAKLSTRSPKDYSWDFRDPNVFEEVVQQLRIILQNHNFDKIQERKPTASEWNLIYQSLLQIPKNRLKIKDGAKFIDMFSHSQRVIIDIGQLETAQGFLFRQFNQKNFEKKDVPLIKVCLREWKDFKWESQFRCFYHKYSLNAITPYVQDAFYNIDQERIKQQLIQFFERVKPKLFQSKLEKGVMDVCLTSQNEIKLIQINTFDENSRGSLFNWKKDRQIMENGPTTIRTLKTHSEDLLTKLPTLMGMVDKGSVNVVRQAVKRINPSIDLSEIAHN